MKRLLRIIETRGGRYDLLVELPPHTLICDCRRCEVSIRTWVRRMRAAE